MNKTSNIRDVLPFVPHRPPMVWVDEIVTFDETSGECRVVMLDGAHFLGAEGLRSTSCLEFIAQAYGYCSVAFSRQKDPNAPPLKKAFLASFKDVVFADSARIAQVKVGDLVQAKFSGVRHIGPIALFNGVAVHAGEVICQAQLKVFCES